MSDISQRMAAKFAPGVRVVGTDGPTGPGTPTPRYGIMQGTVLRFVEGGNAQGGYAVVEWDNGTVGRKGPGSLALVSDIPEGVGQTDA